MILTKLFGVESVLILFLAATGVFLGFTHFWLAGTTVLVGLFIWQKWYFRIHWIPLSLGGLISIAGIWSDDPLAGILWACQLQMLFALWHSPLDKRKLYKWIFAITTVLLIVAIFEVVLLRDSRPETFLVKDASLLGFSGMSTFNPLTGITGSRTAVAGIWAFAIFSARKRLLFAAIIATAFLYVAPLTSVTDFTRYTPAGIETATELRSNVIVQAEVIEKSGGIPWYGLGYHSYVLETGLQRPHNVYMLSKYELGYFAIPFWLLIWIGALYLPKRILILIVPLMFVTEEWFSRPEALSIVFGLVLSAYYWIPKFDLFARFHARIDGQQRDVPVATRKRISRNGYSKARDS